MIFAFFPTLHLKWHFYTNRSFFYNASKQLFSILSEPCVCFCYNVQVAFFLSEFLSSTKFSMHFCEPINMFDINNIIYI